jgi:hypothetical protein
MAEQAAANGDASSGAATASSREGSDTVHQDLGDAENVPKAVESDPTKRYTRVRIRTCCRAGALVLVLCDSLPCEL